MCSEMDFITEKLFSSGFKNTQLLLTAAAALSQNGQIMGTGAKGIKNAFLTSHNEIKCDLRERERERESTFY